MHVLVGDVHRRLAAVGRRTGQQFEEHHAGRIHVRARVGAAVRDLLGRAIRDRAHHQARSRGRDVRLDRAGQPEVCDLHHAVVGEQDVLGLDVAVHQPGAVRCGQGAEHRLHDRDGRGRAEPAALAEQVAQRAALDELHDEEHVMTVGADLVTLVIDRDGVQMGESGRGPGLAGEPVAEVRIGRQRRRHHLDGNEPVEPFVDSRVDRGHTAAGDRLQDPVPAFERTPDQMVVGRRLHERRFYGRSTIFPGSTQRTCGLRPP